MTIAIFTHFCNLKVKQTSSRKVKHVFNETQFVNAVKDIQKQSQPIQDLSTIPPPTSNELFMCNLTYDHLLTAVNVIIYAVKLHIIDGVDGLIYLETMYETIKNPNKNEFINKSHIENIFRNLTKYIQDPIIINGKVSMKINELEKLLLIHENNPSKYLKCILPVLVLVMLSDLMPTLPVVSVGSNPPPPAEGQIDPNY